MRIELYNIFKLTSRGVVFYIAAGFILVNVPHADAVGTRERKVHLTDYGLKADVVPSESQSATGAEDRGSSRTRRSVTRPEPGGALGAMPDETTDTASPLTTNNVTDADTDGAADMAYKAAPPATDIPEDGEICVDTNDLQGCIDAAAAAGGGTVILNADTYTISTSVLLESNVNIVGQGSSSVITWEPSVAATVNEPLLLKEHGNMSNVTLDSFSVLCTVDITDTSDQNRTDHRGIYVVGGGDETDSASLSHSDITVNRVEVSYCGGEGIQMKGVRNFSATDLYMHHNGWGYPDLWHNFYLYRVNGVHMIQTVSSGAGFVASPAGHGMRMGRIQGGYLENLTVSGNADHGIHMDTVSDFIGHNLRVSGNCANPNNTCKETACYNECDENLGIAD